MQICKRFNVQQHVMYNVLEIELHRYINTFNIGVGNHDGIQTPVVAEKGRKTRLRRHWSDSRRITMTGGGRGGGGMNAFPEMTADSTGREADFKAVL